MTKALINRYTPNPATGKLAENQPGNRMWPGQVVTYLTTASARAPYKLEVREFTIGGKKEMRLVDAKGRLFDTREATTHWSKRSGVPRAIFVMNARGELFASNFQMAGEFHHSSLAGGQPVAAAGEMQVIDGKIVDISNQSGHYKPADDYTEQVVRVLRARGLDMAGCRIMRASTPRLIR